MSENIEEKDGESRTADRVRENGLPDGSDLELVKKAIDARTAAHQAWKNVDGNRPTDWSGSSRRFADLMDEIDKRGIDRNLVFKGANP